MKLMEIFKAVVIFEKKLPFRVVSISQNVENAASMDDHGVASLLQSETEPSSKAPDDESANYDKHKSCMAKETAKRSSCRKGRPSKKYNQSSSSSSASDVKPISPFWTLVKKQAPPSRSTAPVWSIRYG